MIAAVSGSGGLLVTYSSLRLFILAILVVMGFGWNSFTEALWSPAVPLEVWHDGRSNQDVAYSSPLKASNARTEQPLLGAEAKGEGWPISALRSNLRSAKPSIMSPMSAAKDENRNKMDESLWFNKLLHRHQIRRFQRMNGVHSGQKLGENPVIAKLPMAGNASQVGIPASVMGAFEVRPKPAGLIPEGRRRQRLIERDQMDESLWFNKLLHRHQIRKFQRMNGMDMLSRQQIGENPVLAKLPTAGNASQLGIPASVMGIFEVRPKPAGLIPEGRRRQRLIQRDIGRRAVDCNGDVALTSDQIAATNRRLLQREQQVAGSSNQETSIPASVPQPRFLSQMRSKFHQKNEFKRQTGIQSNAYYGFEGQFDPSHGLHKGQTAAKRSADDERRGSPLRQHSHEGHQHRHLIRDGEEPNYSFQQGNRNGDRDVVVADSDQSDSIGEDFGGPEWGKRRGSPALYHSSLQRKERHKATKDDVTKEEVTSESVTDQVSRMQALYMVNRDHFWPLFKKIPSRKFLNGSDKSKNQLQAIPVVLLSDEFQRQATRAFNATNTNESVSDSTLPQSASTVLPVGVPYLGGFVNFITFDPKQITWTKGKEEHKNCQLIPGSTTVPCECTCFTTKLCKCLSTKKTTATTTTRTTALKTRKTKTCPTTTPCISKSTCVNHVLQYHVRHGRIHTAPPPITDICGNPTQSATQGVTCNNATTTCITQPVNERGQERVQQTRLAGVTVHNAHKPNTQKGLKGNSKATSKLFGLITEESWVNPESPLTVSIPAGLSTLYTVLETSELSSTLKLSSDSDISGLSRNLSGTRETLASPSAGGISVSSPSSTSRTTVGSITTAASEKQMTLFTISTVTEKQMALGPGITVSSHLVQELKGDEKHMRELEPLSAISKKQITSRSATTLSSHLVQEENGDEKHMRELEPLSATSKKLITLLSGTTLSSHLVQEENNYEKHMRELEPLSATSKKQITSRSATTLSSHLVQEENGDEKHMKELEPLSATSKKQITSRSGTTLSSHLVQEENGDEKHVRELEPLSATSEKQITSRSGTTLSSHLVQEENNYEKHMRELEPLSAASKKQITLLSGTTVASHLVQKENNEEKHMRELESMSAASEKQMTVRFGNTVSSHMVLKENNDEKHMKELETSSAASKKQITLRSDTTAASHMVQKENHDEKHMRELEPLSASSTPTEFTESTSFTHTIAQNSLEKSTFSPTVTGTLSMAWSNTPPTIVLASEQPTTTVVVTSNRTLEGNSSGYSRIVALIALPSKTGSVRALEEEEIHDAVTPTSSFAAMERTESNDELSAAATTLQASAAITSPRVGLTAVEPTTVAPTSVELTSLDPTSPQLTSVVPTTKGPTTVELTSLEPTSLEPTSLEPTSFEAASMERTSIESTSVGHTTVDTASATTNVVTAESVASLVEFTEKELANGVGTGIQGVATSVVWSSDGSTASAAVKNTEIALPELKLEILPDEDYEDDMKRKKRLSNRFWHFSHSDALKRAVIYDRT